MPMFRNKKTRESEETAPQGKSRLLLSSLQEPDNPGIKPPSPNPFQTFQLLGNGTVPLHQIVDKLSGSCTRRESLPTVLAQEELFRLCVQKYGEGESGIEFQDVVNQWKGVVAACLLKDDIFLFSPLSTDEITISQSSNSSGNTFLQCVFDALGDDDTYWTAYCVKDVDMDRLLPLYQKAEDLIAIPAANLNDLLRNHEQGKQLINSIPWIKDEHSDIKLQFQNPLPYLETHQLDRLYDELKDFQEKHPGSPYLLAMQRFQREIRDYQQGDYADRAERYQEIERNLLAALLLRDTLESVLTIREHQKNPPKDAQPENPQPEGMQSESTQSKDIHSKDTHSKDTHSKDTHSKDTHSKDTHSKDVHSENEQSEIEYYVLLDSTPLALLSEEELVTLHHPCAYMDSPAFICLENELKNALKRGACLRHVRSRVNHLYLEKNYSIAEALLTSLKNAKADESETIPICRKRAVSDNVDVRLTGLLKHFNYQAVPALAHPKDFFSRKLAVFDLSDETEKNYSLYTLSNVPKEWYTVYGKNKPVKQTLFPVGRTGAHCLLTHGVYNLQSKSDKMIFSMTEEDQGITVRIIWKVFGTAYELSHVYTPTDLIPIQSPFSLGIWPNCYNSGSIQNFWKHYYTYLYYPATDHSYNANVCYTDGNASAVEEVQNLSEVFDKMDGLEHWGIAKSPKFPLCVELLCGGEKSGVVPCFPNGQYQPVGGRAILAIDFGMSTTVGALVPNAGNLDGAERWPYMQHAGFPDTSCIQWQTYKIGGVMHSMHHFIGEYLGVGKSDSSNALGAMFTLVRRFDLDGKAHYDPLSPFFHGNIEFVGDENTPVYDSHVYSGLKMGQDSPTCEANIGLFLRQMLEMYYFRCYQAGATSIDVRFAYPLAMEDAARDRLYRQFQTICSELSAATGMPLNSLRKASESRAVQTYYHRSDSLNGITSGSVVATVDIGGGTTDFSLLLKAANGLELGADSYFSTTLAGNTMFAHRLFESPALQQEKEKLLVDPFSFNTTPESIQKKNAFFQSDDNDSEENSALKRHFCLVVDQKMRLQNETIANMISDTRSRIHQPLVFQLCLLLWYATMIYREAVLSASAESIQSPQSLFICLAGNGSQFYRFQSKETQDKIRSAVGIHGVNLDIIVSSTQKMEVAQGLVLMEDNELEFVPTQSSSKHDTPTNNTINTSKRRNNIHVLDADSIWNELIEFLNRYLDHFDNDQRIQSIVSDVVLRTRLEAEMKDKVKDLKSLAAHLPILCDMLKIV